jgi:hypothetical protein
VVVSAHDFVVLDDMVFNEDNGDCVEAVETGQGCASLLSGAERVFDLLVLVPRVDGSGHGLA